MTRNAARWRLPWRAPRSPAAAQTPYRQVPAAIWRPRCAICHGTNGGASAGCRVLAGQPKDDLVRQLRDFRDGKRPATIMHQIAKGYTDEQIERSRLSLPAQKAEVRRRR